MRTGKTFAALALIALGACQQTDGVEQTEVDDLRASVQAREERDPDTDADLREKVSPATGPVPATPQQADLRGESSRATGPVPTTPQPEGEKRPAP